MEKNLDYKKAREVLLSAVHPVGTERLPLSECGGRILAETVTAKENVPPFDRSPYDGYAVCAAETIGAGKETPVVFRVIEEIPAGAVPGKKIVGNAAAKVLTGAPIPEGADAVIMYEKTDFTDETVTIFSQLCSGENIVPAGEDVKKGAVLAESGIRIDAGVSGVLAAQGRAEVLVFRLPKVGIISTGSELLEVEEELKDGKIRNSNRYMFETVLRHYGCEAVYLGTAGDSVSEIRVLLEKGLSECDAVLTTGGVSAGDYDLTPDAMTEAGAEILFRGMEIKPGMACAYGCRDGKLILGLSGNPASSLINFYAAALPAVKKICGCREWIPEEFPVRLLNGLKKKSPKTRFLRGKMVLRDGMVSMELPKEQGNVILSSMVGCDMLAVVPAGSGEIPAGSVLKGFLL